MGGGWREERWTAGSCKFERGRREEEEVEEEEEEEEEEVERSRDPCV